MNTVKLEIRSLADTLAEVGRAWDTGSADHEARISFDTPELLWKVLTAKRWELLKALAGQGPMTIREAARRAGRDIKAVHGDVRALLMAGILDRAEDGRRIVFPYDRVHVDFMMQAA
jgi:predicted transcriptional regulator